MKKTRDAKLPPGWDHAKIRKVISHYEKQDEVGAAREDEAALGRSSVTLMKVPRRLVPAVRRLIAGRKGR